MALGQCSLKIVLALFELEIRPLTVSALRVNLLCKATGNTTEHVHFEV